MPSNDNEFSHQSVSPDLQDAHGQAALILVESLMHGLMEQCVLNVGDSVEVVESAIEVQAAIAEAADGASENMWRSHALLSTIATSMRRDLPLDSVNDIRA